MTLLLRDVTDLSQDRYNYIDSTTEVHRVTFLRENSAGQIKTVYSKKTVLATLWKEKKVNLAL